MSSAIARRLHSALVAGLSIPAVPVRERHTGLGRFVSVSDGAYFFLPGIRALRYLVRPRGPSQLLTA